MWRTKKPKHHNQTKPEQIFLNFLIIFNQNKKKLGQKNDEKDI